MAERRSSPPSLYCAPSSAGGSGVEAVELAASVGLDLDPWQQDMLVDALGERDDGRWAASEAATEVPRQNGKGGILEAREIAGLFLLGERLLIHTAHEVKTAGEAFLRVSNLIDGSGDLSREVKRVNRSHGEEGIELHSGQRLRFIARSRASGRGFSCDCLVLDEAFELPETSMAALGPTMSARPNAQTWFMSSSVDREVHPHGLVLARLRRRALSPRPGRLVYYGWSAMERTEWEALDAGEREALRHDPTMWGRANPAYPYRISAEAIERELGMLGSRSFDVERLGIGDWPSEDDDGWLVVPLAAWQACVDVASEPLDPVAMSLDTTTDRSWTSIGAAARRADGLVHLEVVEHRPGTDWALTRASELWDRHRPCAFVVDESGPAAPLIPGLERAGVPVTTVAGREVAAGCAHLLDLVLAGRARHRGTPVDVDGRRVDDGVRCAVALGAALRGARRREIGDKAWAWGRRGIDVVISPLVAVTQAAYGLEVHGQAGEPEIYTL